MRTNKKTVRSKDSEDYFVSIPPQKHNQKRILVFGTYDIIHPAHIRFLTEARIAVNCPKCELIVVVARDSSIERIKGHKPIFSEADRLKLISGLRVVDYARLGNEGEDYLKVILEIKPDFIILGYDQLADDKPLIEFFKKNKLNTKVYRLPHFESGDVSSSSEVREKVLELFNDKK